ncbi:Uncharacterised protein [Achromobacter xylosoxidans]|jgi:hypothetical protein|nr:hypothetical protein LMG26846_05528 [Achromobacter insuavis]CUJ39701.1 Uncharacterised protein [Achromobacter sp. 2789STDY5608621]CUJ45007.1 Uncharacterised protein [Achromobacter xylosoxidans]
MVKQGFQLRDKPTLFGQRRVKIILFQLLLFYGTMLLVTGAMYLGARYDGAAFNWPAELKSNFLIFTLLLLFCNIPWKRLLRRGQFGRN